MFTAETRKPWLTGDRVIAYVAIAVLVAAVVYLYRENTRLRNDLHMQQSDPPIMVGDGSITFEHHGGVIQTSPQTLAVMKANKAISITLVPPSGPDQTIPLSDGWSLTSQGTPGFQLSRSDFGPGDGEGYVAQCPLPASWTKAPGQPFVCATTTKLTPVTLSLPNGTCPTATTDPHTCSLGGDGNWLLRLNYH